MFNYFYLCSGVCLDSALEKPHCVQGTIVIAVAGRPFGGIITCKEPTGI